MISDRRAASGLVARHHRDTDDRARDESEEQARRDDARVQPAEEHAEQRRENHVAEAHPSLAGGVDRTHQSEGDRRAERGHPDPLRFVTHDRCHRQRNAAQRDAGVGDLAWQALGLEIDPGLRHQRRRQDAERRQHRVGTELQAEQYEGGGGRRFDHERFDADRRAAVPALAAQRQPRTDRYQVEERESRVARAACARRCHDRSAARHTIDHHGQERPDHQAHHDAGAEHQCRLHATSTLRATGL